MEVIQALLRRQQIAKIRPIPVSSELGDGVQYNRDEQAAGPSRRGNAPAGGCGIVIGGPGGVRSRFGRRSAPEVKPAPKSIAKQRHLLCCQEGM